MLPSSPPQQPNVIRKKFYGIFGFFEYIIYNIIIIKSVLWNYHFAADGLKFCDRIMECKLFSDQRILILAHINAPGAVHFSAQKLVKLALVELENDVKVLLQFLVSFDEVFDVFEAEFEAFLELKIVQIEGRNRSGNVPLEVLQQPPFVSFRVRPVFDIFRKRSEKSILNQNFYWLQSQKIWVLHRCARGGIVSKNRVVLGVRLEAELWVERELKCCVQDEISGGWSIKQGDW
ncbi:hypothetical protein SS50377_20501 [Spironucleus salmonicida]|uniref:Uncharacterized protein n=1 Tax=Spironucleus salmonicida TaxID=348837 RepID=A0A9P8LZG8_9EUKA|nr:hypothetical protein SS50377_20501 [Spironucleus salmonicida]